eukprot:CAMPEP_0168566316 /NCGR_PEP_ID=MMETSP0413-20121227/14352_1 /TAXON_ID=136452 /ORGANISM="Filamoeba nolandi, Strain NC-AS-23-1" /LENGTH=98 /DNA_ID=CAMNT_0008598323 /DNA_START=115 /DNA_END=407 /DNA_ORIENTATION=+
MEAGADAFGLALIMYELYTSEQPFMKYRRETFDGEEDKRPLADTLKPWREKYKKDEFGLWLIDAMQNGRATVKVMKQKLEEFQKNGKKITRYVAANSP